MNVIPYYKVLMLICLPFIFSFFSILFWISYKFYFKHKFIQVFETVLIIVIITFYFFQSSIINALADLLNCTKIENEYYLTSYLLVKCSGNYSTWRNLMVLPAFCFFSFMLTTLLFLYMYKNRKLLFSEHVLRKVAFLLNGYLANNFYWYKLNLLFFYLKFWFLGSD